MEINDGRLVLNDYPSGSRIVNFDSKVTKRLIRLRVGAKLLCQAKHLMDSVSDANVGDNEQVLEAIAIAVTGYYFACFAQGDLSPGLDPKKVFKGTPDAIERHNDWKKIRDQRFHHPDAIGRTIICGVVVDQAGRYLEFRSFMADIPIGGQAAWMQLLYQLICVAIAHVEESIVKSTVDLKKKFEALSIEQIASLPEPKLHRPDY